MNDVRHPLTNLEREIEVTQSADDDPEPPSVGHWLVEASQRCSDSVLPVSRISGSNEGDDSVDSRVGQ